METNGIPAEAAVLLGMILLIGGGIILLALAMYNRGKLREMDHRERLAMIDRGLVPPPEIDPAGFESALGPRRSAASARSRSVGIITIGFGLALMFMISFAGGSPGPGIGVGGAIAVLGVAFLVNSMMSEPESPPSGSRHPALRSDRPPSPPQPPQNS
jgi:hypothetical protein